MGYKLNQKAAFGVTGILRLADLDALRSEGPESALAAFRCVRIRVQAAVGFEGAKVSFV